MSLTSTPSTLSEHSRSRVSIQDRKTGTTWMDGICQCQRKNHKAPVMCVIPEDSRNVHGASRSQEIFVGSLMTALPAALPAVLRETGLQAHSLEAWMVLSKKWIFFLTGTVHQGPEK